MTLTRSRPSWRTSRSTSSALGVSHPRATPSPMTPAIELKGLGKVYDGTVALAQVTQAFDRGRVHALMGKNGSGKSTLVKILAGAVRPTVGEIYVNGGRAILDTPSDAFAAGIITVHQELSLVPSL